MCRTATTFGVLVQGWSSRKRDGLGCSVTFIFYQLRLGHFCVGTCTIMDHGIQCYEGDRQTKDSAVVLLQLSFILPTITHFSFT